MLFFFPVIKFHHLFFWVNARKKTFKHADTGCILQESVDFYSLASTHAKL